MLNYVLEKFGKTDKNNFLPESQQDNPQPEIQIYYDQAYNVEQNIE